MFVGVCVGVCVGVLLGVCVGVGVDVLDAVILGVGVCVDVDVLVGVLVGVCVGVGVCVDVAVGDKTEEFCFSIKDEGKGFNFNELPDPTAPENLLKESGRGIFLMRNLADDVIYDGVGNSVSIYFLK